MENELFIPDGKILLVEKSSFYIAGNSLLMEKASSELQETFSTWRKLLAGLQETFSGWRTGHHNCRRHSPNRESFLQVCKWYSPGGERLM